MLACDRLVINDQDTHVGRYPAHSLISDKPIRSGERYIDSKCGAHALLAFN